MKTFAVHFHRRCYPIPSDKILVVEAEDKVGAFVVVADYIVRKLGASVLTVDGCGCYLTPEETRRVHEAGIKATNGDYVVWKIEPYMVKVSGRVIGEVV